MNTWRIGFLCLALVSSPSFALSSWASLPQIQEAGQPVADPAAPKPLPEVQAILNEAHQFEEAKKPEEALRAADRALGVAREREDGVGEAVAQETRAKAFEDLKRTNETITAWKEAAHAWELAGNGPGQIETLTREGLLLLSSSAVDAEKLFGQALSVGKSETRRPIRAAQALHAAGIALAARKQQQVAWDFLSTALVIREKRLPDSLDLVETLNQLAKVAVRRGNRPSERRYYSVAKEYYTRALSIGQRLAPNSLVVAESFWGVGQVEWSLENFPAARASYLRALSIQERLAPGSLDLSRTLVDLGNVAIVQGDFAAAHLYLHQALAIREQMAPESEDVASCLNSLAILAKDEGDLTAARESLQRALGINEKMHAEMDSTKNLVNLGAVAVDQYDFAAARQYLDRALDLYAKYEPDAGGVPMVLGNLREAAYREGDLASAIDYGRRALAIFEKISPQSLDMADELTGVGEIFRSQGKLALAEDYYQRGLAIRENLNPQSMDVADSLLNLGRLAQAQKSPTSAIEYDRRALAIAEKVAPDSPYTTESLFRLGELAYEQGDFASAEGYHRGALAIREKTLDSAHPDIGRSLAGLALVLATVGRTPEALAAVLRAEDNGREHLRLSARSLSERQALSYASLRVSSLDLALTLVGNSTGTISAASKVLDSLIRSRALVLDEMAARHRAVHGTEDPDVTGVAKQLFSARTRLAMLVVRGPGDNAPEVYRKLLDQAREEKEQAEHALAEKSIAFRQEQAKSRVGLKEVMASLPPSSGLIAFARYNRYPVRRAPEKSLDPIPSYLAFVMRAGTTEPVVVALGAAKEIESFIADWQKQMAPEVMLAGLSSRRSEATYRKTALILRKKIWDPVAAQLGNTRRIFVVPDGALHLVNLVSLPIGDSGYLIERGPLIHYLSAERDLVPFGTRKEGRGLLALGAPAFDETKLFASLAPKQLASELPAEMPAVSHAFRGTRSTCATFQSMRFEPLPASAREVREVAALWPARGVAQSAQEFRGQQYGESVVELRGAAASEAALKQQVQGKRVLHLATHGFFLGGRCTSALDAKATEFGDSTPAIGDNPLLLSGLAMAGANHRDAAGPDEEDGILTAEEIASLDLNGVDWAVLSACDTGVGEIKAGEGVFGLRRAFQVAGARTVIMSLWQVEDQATRQWMTALYKNRFQRGLGTAESVRAASLQLLSQRRAANQSTHPFYWAGFIAAGDWR